MQAETTPAPQENDNVSKPGKPEVRDEVIIDLRGGKIAHVRVDGLGEKVAVKVRDYDCEPTDPDARKDEHGTIYVPYLFIQSV